MTLNIFDAIFISLYVSIISSIISLILSLVIGFYIAIKKFFFKNMVISIINAFTSIPPVCAGLICYLIVSRSGPLGWLGLLYTPSAMIIAQTIIIMPIMISLIIRNIQEEYPLFEEELYSYGANFLNIFSLLLINKYRIYLTIFIIGFGRAISEYGAAAIVGGSIDQVTRNMTTSISLETAKGNIGFAIQLGIVLIIISFIISIFSNIKFNK